MDCQRQLAEWNLDVGAFAIFDHEFRFDFLCAHKEETKRSKDDSDDYKKSDKTVTSWFGVSPKLKEEAYFDSEAQVYLDLVSCGAKVPFSAETLRDILAVARQPLTIYVTDEILPFLLNECIDKSNIKKLIIASEVTDFERLQQLFAVCDQLEELIFFENPNIISLGDAGAWSISLPLSIKKLCIREEKRGDYWFGIMRVHINLLGSQVEEVYISSIVELRSITNLPDSLRILRFVQYSGDTLDLSQAHCLEKLIISASHLAVVNLPASLLQLSFHVYENAGLEPLDLSQTPNLVYLSCRAGMISNPPPGLKVLHLGCDSQDDWGAFRECSQLRELHLCCNKAEEKFDLAIIPSSVRHLKVSHYGESGSGYKSSCIVMDATSFRDLINLETASFTGMSFSEPVLHLPVNLLELFISKSRKIDCLDLRFAENLRNLKVREGDCPLSIVNLFPGSKLYRASGDFISGASFINAKQLKILESQFPSRGRSERRRERSWVVCSGLRELDVDNGFGVSTVVGPLVMHGELESLTISNVSEGKEFWQEASNRGFLKNLRSLYCSGGVALPRSLRLLSPKLCSINIGYGDELRDLDLTVVESSMIKIRCYSGLNIHLSARVRKLVLHYHEFTCEQFAVLLVSVPNLEELHLICYGNPCDANINLESLLPKSLRYLVIDSNRGQLIRTREYFKSGSSFVSIAAARECRKIGLARNGERVDPAHLSGYEPEVYCPSMYGKTKRLESLMTNRRARGAAAISHGRPRSSRNPLDSQTEDLRPRLFAKEWLVGWDGRKPNCASYRVDFANRIELSSDGQLLFRVDYSAVVVEEVLERRSYDDILPAGLARGEYWGSGDLVLKGDQSWQPIPSLTPQDIVACLAVASSDEVEVGYVARLGCNVIRLKNRGRNRTVTIRYILRTKAREEFSVSEVMPPEIPEVFYTAIDRILQRCAEVDEVDSSRSIVAVALQSLIKFFSSEDIDATAGLRPLAELFSSLSELDSDDKKIAALYDYCFAFSGKELLRIAELDTILDGVSAAVVEQLTIICRQAGVCRHASRAFFILYGYCIHKGLIASENVILVQNDVHMFPEMGLGAGQVKMDVGGGRAEVFVTPLEVPDKHEIDVEAGEGSAGDFVSEDRAGEAVGAAEAEEEVVDPEIQRRVEMLRQFRRNLLTAETSHDFAVLLVQKARAERLKIVLKVPDTGFATRLYRSILNELEECWPECYAANSYLYIDSPEDLNSLLHDVQVVAGSDPLILDGPLQEILNSALGLLVINWSKFTPAEIASYQSLLERVVKLAESSYPECKLRVIGILNSELKLSDDFYSRFSERQVAVPQAVLDDLPSLQVLEVCEEVLEDGSDSEPIVVNLYAGAIDWRVALLGYITVGDLGWEFVNGELLTALESGRELILVDPPNSEELQRFFLELPKRGFVIINGNKVDVADGFRCRVVRSAPLQLPDTIDIEAAADDAILDRSWLIVNQQTYLYLFARLYVGEDREFHSMPGLLATLAEVDRWKGILITADISCGQLRRILDALTSLDVSCKLRLAPGVKVINLPSERSIAVLPPSAIAKTVTQTDDLSYSLARPDVEDDDQVVTIPVNPETSWSDLVESVSLDMASRTVSEYRPGRLLQHLRDGKRVILYGTISRELYQKLEPLLYRPGYLEVGGEIVTFPGELCLFTEQDCAADLSVKANVEKVEVTMVSCQELLHAKGFSKVLVDKLFLFLGFARRLQLVNNNVFSMLTYARLHALLSELAEHPDCDAVEIVSNYLLGEIEGESVEYAYLQVFVKILFVTGERYLNYSKLINLWQGISQEEVTTKFWQLANCFSGAALREIFGCADLFRRNLSKWAEFLVSVLQEETIIPQDAMQLRLLEAVHGEFIRNKLACSSAPLSYRDRGYEDVALDRQIARIQEFVVDDSRRAMIILGEPGVGKSYTAEHLGVATFMGMENLQVWLDAEDGGVLVIDEFNLQPGEKWQLFAELNRSVPTVLGRPISDRHKVLFIGNPFWHRGRKISRPLGFAPILFFEADSHEAMLRKTILVEHSEFERITAVFSFALNYLSQHFAGHSFGNRDLHNLAWHYHVLSNDDLELPFELDALAIHVCLRQFIDLFNDESNKREFVATLAREFDLELSGNELALPIPESLPDFVVTHSRYKAIVAIQEMLLMREAKCFHADCQVAFPGGKNGILLEGSSGEGKSHMALAVLQAQGFCDGIENPEAEKKYYHLTARSRNLEELIEQAAREGSILIVDEINVDPRLEQLLNGYMGTQGRVAAHPGFMVIATQNPGMFAGRKPFASAFANRFWKVTVPAYSQSELLEIIRVKNPGEESIAMAIYRARSAAFEDVNLRSLYADLESCRALAAVG